MYKIEELRAKKKTELLKLISELKGKLLALRFENSTGQLKEPHLLSTTRHDIARIFTVLREQEKISLSDRKKMIRQEENKSKQKKAKSSDKTVIKETASSKQKKVLLTMEEYKKLTIPEIKKHLQALELTFKSSAKKGDLLEILDSYLKAKGGK